MTINSTIRDIDLAWEQINSLGGTPVCTHDHVYNLAVNDALRIIESLGGYDPAERRQAVLKMGKPPRLVSDDRIPLARMDALQGDGPEDAA